MTKTLHQDWIIQPHLQALFKALGKDKLRFIGGCVRDALLGRDIHDIDMATELTPDDVLKKLEANNIKAIPTGIQHGTITAVSDNIPIEITTLRSDIACDGRHAEVTFTTSWEEDAQRRDFTMNALSCDNEGNIYDYTHGLKDLKAGHLRFIGNADERCSEDYLRILRYFRFHATLTIQGMEESAIKACMQQKEGIQTLSGERIQHEMVRLLAAPRVLNSLKMMEMAGVLALVLRQDTSVDVITHLDALERATNHPTNPWIRLAALCRSNDFSQTELNSIIQRWKLSNRDKQALLKRCFPERPLPESLTFGAHRPLIRSYGRDLYSDLLLLQWACGGATEHSSDYFQLYDKALQWVAPTFPLSGKDLIQAGFSAGKEIGILLQKAENYWEKQDYCFNKDELLTWLKQQA